MHIISWKASESHTELHYKQVVTPLLYLPVIYCVAN